LLQHFRDFYGVSPMRYLRNHRLQRVRDELLSETAGQVSEIASRWGFAHLGRFAAEYRRRFGECPSVTRARGLLSRRAPASGALDTGCPRSRN
jgi:transcriptional regulator GlxA family with amidase domain